ncbi:MAG: lipoyl(octanoyl) transferase LipB [Candidatus Binataceae bacterium]
MTQQRAELAIAELGLVEYEHAHALQQALVAARIRDEIADTLLLLEHPHVYTLGRGADERFILAARPGVPIVRVSRGGEVTYHGPGQVVGYPIIKLEGAARDVGRYLRDLEQVMIGALAQYGIAAARREKLTGVWIEPRKIGSIGVGIRRWVTYHGLAINVSTDLNYFESIVPCGIAGCEMTSVAHLGHPEVGAGEFSRSLGQCFGETFGYARTVRVEAQNLWQRIDRPRSIAEASN